MWSQDQLQSILHCAVTLYITKVFSVLFTKFSLLKSVVRTRGIVKCSSVYAQLNAVLSNKLVKYALRYWVMGGIPNFVDNPLVHSLCEHLLYTVNRTSKSAIPLLHTIVHSNS